jgi:branched-chain amino acid transport system ATP-binding protein
MTGPVLEVGGLMKVFGGFVALNGVEFEVGAGERLGLIGPNGSGKTTLINCITGALTSDAGTVRFRGTEVTGMKAHERTRLGIARSFQIPRPFASMTLVENLCIPLEFAGRREFHSRQETEGAAQEILALVGLADRGGDNSAGLTQVDMRKLDLARAMAASPDLLISDEAMAGLTGTEIDDILAVLMTLNERGIAIIMVEHIMRAVMQFSERVMVLDAGQKIALGTPAEIVNNPDVERAYLGE